MPKLIGWALITPVVINELVLRFLEEPEQPSEYSGYIRLAIMATIHIIALLVILQVSHKKDESSGIRFAYIGAYIVALLIGLYLSMALRLG